jgi:hypothetical protein
MVASQENSNSPNYHVTNLMKGNVVKFFHKLSQRFPRWMFKVNRAVIMTTPSPKIVFRRYKNYVFSKATENDIPEIAKLTDAPEEILRDRMAGGDWGFVTKNIAEGNKIVNIIWGHRGSCYVRGLGVDLDIGDNSAYLHGGYTSEKDRMKGIFNTALKDVYDILLEQGISNLYALIEDWNEKSYHYHLRLKFKPIATVTFIIMFYIKASFYKDLETGRGKFKIFLNFPKDRSLI